MWKFYRGLTLLGRIQIVKKFAISKFMSKASLILVSDDLINKLTHCSVVLSGKAMATEDQAFCSY